jgi:hypothetical protein
MTSVHVDRDQQQEIYIALYSRFVGRFSLERVSSPGFQDAPLPYFSAPT